jgi:hypothetical protein
MDYKLYTKLYNPELLGLPTIGTDHLNIKLIKIKLVSLMLSTIKV